MHSDRPNQHAGGTNLAHPPEEPSQPSPAVRSGGGEERRWAASGPEAHLVYRNISCVTQCPRVPGSPVAAAGACTAMQQVPRSPCGCHRPPLAPRRLDQAHQIGAILNQQNRRLESKLLLFVLTSPNIKSLGFFFLFFCE